MAITEKAFLEIKSILEKKKALPSNCDIAAGIELASATEYLHKLVAETSTENIDILPHLKYFFEIRPSQFSGLNTHIDAVRDYLVRSDYIPSTPELSTSKKLTRSMLYIIFSDMVSPSAETRVTSSWFSSIFSQPKANVKSDVALTDMGENNFNYYQVVSNERTAVLDLCKLNSDLIQLCSIPDDLGFSPIHHAVIKDEVLFLIDLINIGVDLNAKTKTNKTALMLSVEKNSELSFVELVTRNNVKKADLASIVDSNDQCHSLIKDYRSASELLKAVVSGDISKINNFFSNANIEDKEKLEFQKKALHFVLRYANYEMSVKIVFGMNVKSNLHAVICLLLMHADIESKETYKYYFYRCGRGVRDLSANEFIFSLDDITLFKKHYPKFATRCCVSQDCHSVRPNADLLIMALKENSFSIVNHIIKENPSGILRSGNVSFLYPSPLDFALSMKNYSAATELIKLGADPCCLILTMISSNETLLHFMARNNSGRVDEQRELILLILSKINEYLSKNSEIRGFASNKVKPSFLKDKDKDKDGLNLLSTAVKYEHTVLIEILIDQHGIDLSEKYNGKTLIEVATEKKWDQIKEKLTNLTGKCALKA